MFQSALEQKYDWFLGLDADIVLQPDWLEKARLKRLEAQESPWFVFSLAVADKFVGHIDRGNHFYNGECSEEALRVLDRYTKHHSKPESSICQYIDRDDLHFGDTVIGYHGYEQFYQDIFFRFRQRAKRGTALIGESSFLTTGDSCFSDQDFFVAQRGLHSDRHGILTRFKKWFPGKKCFFDSSDRAQMLAAHLPDIPEKQPLTISYEEFLALQQKEES
jgi:hypothetical protein